MPEHSPPTVVAAAIDLPAVRDVGHCPRYAASMLFAAAREVEIEHRGEIYRLRITRQERLIPTK